MTIKKKLLAAQSRQKSYTDSVKRRPLTFSVGDHVFLKVSPWKGVQRFGKKGKLASRYIGPFEILERVGEVAYQLALPPALSNVHDVFHISMLRRYVPDPSHVLDHDTVPVQDDLSCEELPVRILDRKMQTLRNRTISMIKVQWRFHKPDAATWEREEDIRERYPHLL
ncbi:Chromo domain-containing protein [Cephalotus follicularis]|uniref:Chromo domain-containing protein n=1 Tax=Cephalotus follicularis TaxID=3775 RepID=A0A1Q3CI69_CEPFO|nr:Chromo domain-containing protein [Cephalotus follicularis]